MSSDGTAADDRWDPQLGRESGREGTQFKWGLRARDVDPTVWEVSGPGDGFPSHDTYLETAWGRMPSTAAGDMLGIATWEPPQLTIKTYYSEDVPQPVRDAFREMFPTETLS